MPPSSAPLVMCHCEDALRPWQSALPDNGLASGGSLSFCGERKGGKNAAKTNGFGILFADRIQQDPELSNHANLTLQNSRLAFASSLRLQPRRALRLCWPGGTGGASASAVGRREGTPPYGGLPANGAQGSASRTTRSRACTAPHAKNHVIAKPVRTLAVAIRNTKNKFPSSEVIVYVRSIPYPQLFYHRSH